MTVVLQIAENILLLSFMGLAYLLLESNRARMGDALANLSIGLCFGLTAALVTVVPVTLGDGATVDARAGPVILSGIVAGPTAALLTAALGAAARGYVGGSFAFSGVAVYVVYALLGMALRHLRLVSVDKLPSWRTIGWVVLASWFGAMSVVFLIRPVERALYWLANDLPLILMANAMSVAYTAACIGLVIIYARRSAEVIRVNEALRLAKRAGRFGIWDYDIASGRLAWDETSRELHGVGAADFRATFDDWARNVHPDDLDTTRQRFFDALQSDAEGIFDSEYRVVLPDGSINWVKGDAVVIRDANGDAVRVVGSNIDLTAIRKTESQLAEAQSVAMQAQKMETVGQLTGGIAHDFNNLLAVIHGNLELLLMKLEEDGFSRDKAKKYVADSLNAAKRGAGLTQNMLAYARKAQLNPVALDLNDIVRQTDQWISRTIESSIKIELRLDDDLWLTMVDMSSMQSALVNLLVNARDAVGGSGRIAIETSNAVIDEEFIGHAGERLEPGRYVMLAVRDSGVGMESDAIGKMFDPFYSTKPVGQGTGLGLSMVQGFVEQSRGAITVESTPGRGTQLRLYFPAHHGPDLPASQGAEKAASTLPGRESSARILLVEDEPGVRTVVERMLQSCGHRVQTASSGDAAFELCRSNGAFDLVITDVVMPGDLQGPELVHALKSEHPAMRFLFITGYDSVSRAEDAGIALNAARLVKPFSQEQLLKAVEAALKS